MLEDGPVAMEVTLADGRHDLHFVADRRPGPFQVTDWGLTTDCDACIIRLDATGRPSDLVLCNGGGLSLGEKSWDGAEGVEGGST